MEYFQFIVPSCILGLWWYDHLLLLKSQEKIKNGVVNILWKGLGLWSNTFSKDYSMIKDGYHVDFVILYQDKCIGTKRKGIDVTSIFRKLILKNIFHNCKIEDFIDECSNVASNIDTFSKENIYELEIQYTFDFKKYKVFFDNEYNNLITFPVYPEQELRGIPCLNSEGILSATLKFDNNDKSIDITNDIIESAGPLGNFYKDKSLIILKDWVLPQFLLNDYSVTIIDSNAGFHEFTYHDPFFSI